MQVRASCGAPFIIEVLFILCIRFLFNPPEGSSDKDLEKFKKWSGPVRLRFVCTLSFDLSEAFVVVAL